MHRPALTCGFLALLLAAGSVARGAGLNSMGNTDGVLTWSLGTLAPGKTARHVVLLSYDKSHEALAERLDAARKHFGEMREPPYTQRLGRSVTSRKTC